MKHRNRPAGGASVMNGDGHVIGIDLGATAVRAAVLSPKVVGGKTTVSQHGFGAVTLPEGAVVNGVVLNGDAVTAALKELWTTFKFNCSKVILGATSQQVMVRDFTVPNLPPEQIKKALPYQAREVIALPLDQALLHFSPLGPPAEGDGTITGLLSGIPREPVVTAVRAVEKAKLRVVRVDLAPFGLLRAIGTSGPAIEALVDVGAHLTTIVIHANGIAKVVRVVQHGGASWTAHIADQADLPTDEAEATKCTIGLMGSNLATRLLRDAMRPLVNEVRGSINFFASQHRVSVERVSLTGGSAQLLGLREYLTEQLATPVDVVKPTRHVSDVIPTPRSPRGAYGHSYASAVSVGLAMGVAA